jgi:hypothetical protein
VVRETGFQDLQVQRVDVSRIYATLLSKQLAETVPPRGVALIRFGAFAQDGIRVLQLRQLVRIFLEGGEVDLPADSANRAYAALDQEAMAPGTRTGVDDALLTLEATLEREVPVRVGAGAVGLGRFGGLVSRRFLGFPGFVLVVRDLEQGKDLGGGVAQLRDQQWPVLQQNK